MNSYIDALKAKYNMSNVDCVRLKDLLNGFKELGYGRGYSEGYSDGYKRCIQDVSREQEKLFAQVNGTVDRMESRLREYFEGV